MTIKLPSDLEQRLKAEASQHGVEPGEFAATLLDRALRRPDQVSLDVLARWEAENQTDDPAEIARREEELRTFKDAINRNRRDAEGAGTRTPFP